MIDAATFVKFLHIVAGIGLIAGIIGRAFALAQANRSPDIHTVNSLVQLGGRFESLLVRPGSFVVLGLGILLAWLQGWPLLGFIQGGQSNWLLVSLLLYFATIPLIIFVFVPRGKLFEQALGAALAEGQVTPELTRAFNDQAVRMAHYVEGLLIIAILYLMVAKPF
jgi:uncharacterized membrane protein